MSKEKIKSRWLFFGKDKYTYDTIDELVNKSMGLAVGEVVTLNGYYSADDGATHKRVIADTDDGSGVQLRSGKWANIVHNGEVNVSWFGAKGDGVADDTEAIQKAIDNASTINFSNKTYMIDGTKDSTTVSGKIIGLKIILANPKIINFNNSKVKCIANNSDKYTMLFINSNNIILNNPTFIGDRDEHIKTPSSSPNNKDGYSGEWGHGIYLLNSENIKIKNADVSKCWGDSFVILGGKNIVIDNMTAHYSRRQGLTISAGENIIINNPYIHHISGTMPQDAIDIEPYDDEEILNNVHINNLVSHDCDGSALELSTKLKGDFFISKIYSRNKNAIGLYAKENSTSRIIIGDLDIEQLYIPCYNTDGYIEIKNLITKGRLLLGSGYKGHFFKTPIINIDNYVMTEGSYRVIGGSWAKDSTFDFKENRITINNIELKDVAASKGIMELNIPINIKNINTESIITSSTPGINVFRDVNVILNKPVDLIFFIDKNDGILGTKTLYKNIAKDKKVTFTPRNGTTLNGDTASIIFPSYFACMLSTKNGTDYILETIYKSESQLNQLNTPYHVEKMQQEGVYDDFIMYMDDKVAYDKEQQRLGKERQAKYQKDLEVNPKLTYEEWLSQQPALLPYMEEPRPTSALQKFMDKYL